MVLSADKLKQARARVSAAWAKSRLPVCVATALLLFVAGLGWATDWITIQNERTVYTVDCRGGEWQGAQCTGHLVPGARYGFRVSTRGNAEVAFWTVGDRERSGKLTPCTVTDGRNWVCKPCPDAAR